MQLGNQNPPLNVKLVKSPTPQPGPLCDLLPPRSKPSSTLPKHRRRRAISTAAIASYREDLLSKVPALTTGYLRVGALLEQKGDAAAALETYRQLARLEPDNARAAAAIARLARIP